MGVGVCYYGLITLCDLCSLSYTERSIWWFLFSLLAYLILVCILVGTPNLTTARVLSYQIHKMKLYFKRILYRIISDRMDFGLCLYSTLLPSARDHGVFSLVNKEAVLEVRGDLRLDVMSQT